MGGRMTAMDMDDTASTALEDHISALVGQLPQPLMLVCLQRVQEELGYVPDVAVPIVARACGVSRAEVHGVLTYYRDLRRTPPAPVQVQVCLGEACQAVGARALLTSAQTLAETNPDIEVHEVFCVGNCALGPNAVVNGRLHGRMDTADLASLATKRSRS